MTGNSLFLGFIAGTLGGGFFIMNMHLSAIAAAIPAACRVAGIQ